MFKRFLAAAMLVGVCAMAHAQQEPFNAGTTTISIVSTNLPGNTNSFPRPIGRGPIEA
jgi:hypothetical protein